MQMSAILIDVLLAFLRNIVLFMTAWPMMHFNVLILIGMVLNFSIWNGYGSKIQSTARNIRAWSGVEGYETNHSLRVTASINLYHKGVDEQFIMECTGHYKSSLMVSKPMNVHAKSKTQNFHMTLCFLVVKKDKRKKTAAKRSIFCQALSDDCMIREEEIASIEDSSSIAQAMTWPVTINSKNPHRHSYHSSPS